MTILYHCGTPIDFGTKIYTKLLTLFTLKHTEICSLVQAIQMKKSFSYIEPFWKAEAMLHMRKGLKKHLQQQW